MGIYTKITEDKVRNCHRILDKVICHVPFPFLLSFSSYLEILHLYSRPVETEPDGSSSNPVTDSVSCAWSVPTPVVPRRS